MNVQEIIQKLDENYNFHLTFQVFLITDDNVIDIIYQKLKDNYKVNKILNVEDSYDILKKAYEAKEKIILCNEKISYLLPLATFILKDDVSCIKPMIPTFYLLKDNKIIQKVKTTCNCKMSNYTSIKNVDEILEIIVSYLEKRG